MVYLLSEENVVLVISNYGTTHMMLAYSSIEGFSHNWLFSDKRIVATDLCLVIVHHVMLDIPSVAIIL